MHLTSRIAAKQPKKAKTQTTADEMTRTQQEPVKRFVPRSSLMKLRLQSVITPNTKTIAPPICKNEGVRTCFQRVQRNFCARRNFFLLTKMIKLLMNIPYLTNCAQKFVRPPTPILVNLRKKYENKIYFTRSCFRVDFYCCDAHGLMCCAIF